MAGIGRLRAALNVPPMLRKLLGGLVAAAIAGGLIHLALLEAFEYGALDRLFRFRGPRPPIAPVVVINIDEDSFDGLDQSWPFPRAMHGALLEIIASGEPLVIAVDDPQDLTRLDGIRAIFQGGAKHDLTGHSFVASANYATALGRSATRVVSCNTTSTVRTLFALKEAGLLARAPLEQLCDLLRPPLEHRPDERPHHVPEKAVGGDLELERLAAAVPGGGLDHAHEDLVLGLGRREGAEVVLAEEEIGRVGERRLVERARHPPAAALLEGRG